VADGPSHAQVVRPAPVELFLWTLWRAAYRVGVALDALATKADDVRNADPMTRRLVVAAAGLALAAAGLGGLLVFLLV
jgi:hypothetical protein